MRQTRQVSSNCTLCVALLDSASHWPDHSLSNIIIPAITKATHITLDSPITSAALPLRFYPHTTERNARIVTPGARELLITLVELFRRVQWRSHYGSDVLTEISF